MMPPPAARILFVDDEPSIRKMLPAVLQQHGFEVRVAATVAEALVEINAYDFGVLICDLNLEKEGDGFLVVSAMRHIQPNCVNLILTGYPALESAMQAIHNQVDDYLIKPADIELLLKTIRERLDNRGHPKSAQLKKLPVLLKEHAAEIERRVVSRIQQDLKMQNFGCSGDAHAANLPALIGSLVEHLDSPADDSDSRIVDSGAEHGRLRRKQGCSLSILCDDFQAIQQAVYGLIRTNLDLMAISGLLVDLEKFHTALNLAMAKSLEAFETRAKRSA